MTTPLNSDQSIGELLSRVDSVTSLVAHRHSSDLPDGVRAELLDVSHACRRITESDDTLVVVVRRDDATVLVLGPLDAALKKQQGSVRRLRETVARALGYRVASDEKRHDA